MSLWSMEGASESGKMASREILGHVSQLWEHKMPGKLIRELDETSRRVLGPGVLAVALAALLLCLLASRG